MPTSFPPSNDYQQAIQNPSVRFTDPILKNCTVEKDLMGLPRVLSGNFALTYRLSRNGQSWAVRCFTRTATEREERYAAICQFLSAHPSRYFVQTRYIPQGILVSGNWYPITVMDWVVGKTLENYILDNLRDSC